MNRRLEAIAGLVRNGKGLIDVGTDHGYLAIHLLQTRRRRLWGTALCR